MPNAVRDENRIPAVRAALRAAEGSIAESIATDVNETVRENWSAGKNALGGAWAPNAPETIRQKGGSTPLIDTGETREAMGVSAEGDTARVGPTTDEAAKLIAIHEHGVPEQNIPARPVIGPAGEYAHQVAEDVAERTLTKTLAGVTL
ncbi:phage virion morphogenesis protein [Halomarina salina]|uniref:Phage virion morphogenesis protein n=1 Tax=Halomarina salina TaxID=1872699 RepID=A0ABD5RTK8_9EURY|nr:phage virion morphogenesis protein [Halomarina salina]